MFGAKEIRQITFERVVRGYRPEDVESFMEKIADEFETIVKEKSEIEEQLYILAEKIEQYKQEEESIKNTLINAQKLGDKIINEAKQIAEAVVKEATIRKNDILASGHEELSTQEEDLARIKKEVSDFKISILSLYKKHIESISTLPEVKKEPAGVVIEETDPAIQEPTQKIAEKQQQQQGNTINIEKTVYEEPAAEVEEDAEDIIPENFLSENKKLIDDYAISPESHEGFNNISTLFDK